MAPNRKTHELFATNAELESLKTTVQAKYLPLTSEIQRQPQPQQQALVTDPKTEKQPPTVSYWDWAPDTAEEEKAEAIDDFFSLARFESNLISDSLRRERNETTADEEPTEESQSYWDWSVGNNDTEAETDSQENESVPQQDHKTERHGEECNAVENYWDWTGESDHEDDPSASRTDHLHRLVSSSRKKYHRRHYHLPEPECHVSDPEGSAEHFWHWAEFHGKDATVQ